MHLFFVIIAFKIRQCSGNFINNVVITSSICEHCCISNDSCNHSTKIKGMIILFLKVLYFIVNILLVYISNMQWYQAIHCLRFSDITKYGYNAVHSHNTNMHESHAIVQNIYFLRYCQSCVRTSITVIFVVIHVMVLWYHNSLEGSRALRLETLHRLFFMKFCKELQKNGFKKWLFKI